MLSVGYLLIGALAVVKVNSQHIAVINHMKNLGARILEYKKDNGHYPEAENIPELLDKLEIDTSIPKDSKKNIKDYVNEMKYSKPEDDKEYFLRNVQRMTYSKPTDNNAVILLWSSMTIRKYDAGRNWMKRYHYEVSFSAEDGCKTSQVWDD